MSAIDTLYLLSFSVFVEKQKLYITNTKIIKMAPNDVLHVTKNGPISTLTLALWIESWLLTTMLIKFTISPQSLQPLTTVHLPDSLQHGQWLMTVKQIFASNILNGKLLEGEFRTNTRNENLCKWKNRNELREKFNRL